MNEQQAYAVVGLLTQSYRRDEWGPDRIRLWVRLLEDLPFGDAQAAVLSWVSTERWPPTVADIRQRACAPAAGLPGAEAAWEELLLNVRRIGSWGEPMWSSPVAERAMVALRGGWQELCGALAEDELVAERAHFLRIYEGFAAERRAELQALPAGGPRREITDGRWQ